VIAAMPLSIFFPTGVLIVGGFIGLIFTWGDR
jgi:hypothetical protein